LLIYALLPSGLIRDKTRPLRLVLIYNPIHFPYTGHFVNLWFHTLQQSTLLTALQSI